jgi:hypothetical protein
METTLNEALKKAVPGGDPVEVRDQSGKIIGYCGIGKTWKVGDPI